MTATTWNYSDLKFTRSAFQNPCVLAPETWMGAEFQGYLKKPKEAGDPVTACDKLQGFFGYVIFFFEFTVQAVASIHTEFC